MESLAPGLPLEFELKREHAAFLIGGLLFGVLFGYGLFNLLDTLPAGGARGATAETSGPAGPAAPTQVAGGGAPAMQQVNELKRELEQNPKDVSAMLKLGDLYRQIGQWDPAIGYYDRALETDPDNVELRRALAYMYQDSGRCDKAVPYYERLLEREPGNADLLTDLGVCFRALGRYDEALEQFRRASQSDPEHWQSVFNTVVVAGLDLGRDADADAAMRRLRELRPDSPDVDRLADSLARQRGSREG